MSSKQMRALILTEVGQPLQLAERPIPEPGPGEVRLRVSACGVCRTDLHVVDGELPVPALPLIPGHQIVGCVEALGPGADPDLLGRRVGVPWLGWTCDRCRYCLSGRENLCDDARFTGYNRDGGFAEFAIADQRYCFAIPEGYEDVQAAPLLCAGLIAYRCLRMAGEAKTIGLYGFGAAAHILTQVASFQGRTVYGFTRPGDVTGQQFALEMGAHWAGGTDQEPPGPLDAAILFAPAGELVPIALEHVAKGGIVVCGGIHMTDVPSFPYSILWGERSIRSVANLTRADGTEFLALAPRIPVRTEVRAYALEQGGAALDDLRTGRVRGAAVIVP